ncbi:MAG: UDP-N-acetylmuramoyl-L-alanyl-D-glutamate--2,6-diaminopimelate ligase [Eggerthellaceae bacterium]|nr:UDP-N-acetylmuramoyl-L-alanyl-D-glutamate--2,6-diaminopimelate ligase [Eggerthellaceae bacterium]
MSKTCAQLCAAMGGMIIGNAEESIEGLAYRSDKVEPGYAFFCIVGLKTDGHSFAQDAINRGAKVLVVERKVYLADATDVTEIIVKDSRKALAQAADAFYGHPSQDMTLVGITGTNGKTTTTYLVNHIVNSIGKRCAVIGTVGITIGDVREKSEHTTPESSDLQALFARMRDAQCDVVAMEVSSHALDLMRTWGTDFAVTAFTNLTQDHLDYHHTFEAYFEAKALLFSRDYPAKRVICIDDKWGRELLKRCTAAEDSIITTGFSEDAQIHPVEIDYHHGKTKVTLSVRGAKYSFEYPLVGRFNVSNVMTAFAIALSLGYSAEAIIRTLPDVPGVPGRLQRVNTQHDGGVSVYVDYAHTPDALEKAIGSLAELKPQRLIVVFGCGGDRDATKRSIMGRTALSADYAVVTSDNPRSEDPLAIIEDIVAGMGTDKDRFEIEPDRRCAIRRAIAIANPGDAILVAGKGHEDYQIIGDEKHWFDDVVVAAEELESRFA